MQAVHRAKKDDEQKASDHLKDKKRKAEKRGSMTEEEKDLVKEKDRIRKKKMREKKKAEQEQDLKRRIKEGEFAHKGEYYQAKDKRLTKFGLYSINPSIKNPYSLRYYEKISQQKSRGKRSEEKIEFDKIVNLLNKRNEREQRDGKAHLLDNLEAKQGMRKLKKNGPIKSNKDYMRKKAREKDEEVMWQMFWNRGRKYKDLLKEKKPELAKLFKEKEENARKKQEERDRKEKELDEKGQWKYNNCDGEYYWSIPDENGHNMSLAEFNREDEDIPLTIEQLRAQSNERA